MFLKCISLIIIKTIISAFLNLPNDVGAIVHSAHSGTAGGSMHLRHNVYNPP